MVNTKYSRNPKKTPLTGHITYSDGIETYHEDFYIDLDKYATFFWMNSVSDNLLEETKKQTKELETISEALMSMASKTEKKSEDEDE